MGIAFLPGGKPNQHVLRIHSHSFTEDSKNIDVFVFIGSRSLKEREEGN